MLKLHSWSIHRAPMMTGLGQFECHTASLASTFAHCRTSGRGITSCANRTKRGKVQTEPRGSFVAVSSTVDATQLRRCLINIRCDMHLWSQDHCHSHLLKNPTTFRRHTCSLSKRQILSGSRSKKPSPLKSLVVQTVAQLTRQWPPLSLSGSSFLQRKLLSILSICLSSHFCIGDIWVVMLARI